MVRRGWSHRDLIDMAEAEFLFLLDQQLEFDRAEAEARRKAIERAGRR